MTMKILYISSKKKWGGICSWMEKTALALEDRGHNVFIISHPNSEFTRQSDRRLNLIVRRLGFMYSPFMILWAINFIKKHKIDLVVANIEKEIVAGGIAAKLCGIPLLRRVGNEGDFKDRLKYQLHHKLLVDHTMTISNFTKQESLKRVSWVDTKKFTVVYHGRKVTNFSFDEILMEKKKIGIEENKIVLGVTSRLTKEKGVEDIIRAFYDVLSDYPQAILVITGKEEDEKLRGIVKSLGIESNVYFAGFTSMPMLRAAIYDIALTYTNNEAIPNTLFEYLAVGCPTISSKIGGIPELIEDEVNGLLVEAKSPQKLAKKIALLIKNESKRVALSKKAKLTMGKKFSEKAMIDNVETLYMKLVENA